MLLTCESFERKDRWGNLVVEMDEQCISHVARHVSHVTRQHDLQWFREECKRLLQQQQRVVEVHLPIDPEAQWKVSDVRRVTCDE